jgi:membrane protease YdiL (CAAX protease family)
MVSKNNTPWEPNRGLANAMIILLAAVIACLLFWKMKVTHRAPPSDRVSMQARLWEIQASIKPLATGRLLNLMPRDSLASHANENPQPWDRALVAVLLAEDGDLEGAKSLAAKDPLPSGSAGEAFRRCFAVAYLGEGQQPSTDDRSKVTHALRDGYAARLLEARLAERADPTAAQRLRDEARRWAIPRLAGLAAAGGIFMLMLPCGLAMALILALSAKAPRPFPVPALRMPGRALAIAFLAWFLAFLLSGTVIGGIVMSIPYLRPYALPLTYAFHATAGIALLCKVEGLTLGQFLRRWMPGSHGKSTAWGLGFLALAFVMVMAVALISSRFVKTSESPQRELMDLVTSIHGVLPLTMLLVTVSVLAPIFEECLFRGTFLPWLGHRFQNSLGQRKGWLLALIVTSLGFGLIHLQPVAFPVLSTLGLALGLAFLRTRNLLTSIVVHGLWNGGIFLFYRIVFG